MLITESYRAANAHLHATTDFGVTAPRFADMIQAIAAKYRVGSCLDYGSGARCWVARMLQCDVRSYDPCIPELAEPPTPAAMLVCCDVLEHIEPECLEDVLNHMGSLMQRVGFLTIATRPAKKVLPDGRNAHLIVEGPEFWLPRIMSRWRVRQFMDMVGELIVHAEVK